MGLNIGKYRFNSKEQAESKIEGLGIEQDENGTITQHINIQSQNLVMRF